MNFIEIKERDVFYNTDYEDFLLFRIPVSYILLSVYYIYAIHILRRFLRDSRLDDFPKPSRGSGVYPQKILKAIDILESLFTTFCPKFSRKLTNLF